MAQLPVITTPAGAAAVPGPAAPEPERRRVARLLHRAGFGDKVEVIDQWAAKGYLATVDHLLSFPPASGRPDEAIRVAQEGSQPANKLEAYDLTPLARMWLNRMAATQYPLEEKLTLYWHNHFATAFAKVQRPRLMVTQNRLLRDHAGGNFRDLAKAITADAAMLYWLDGNTNQLAAPNENYGREFMELFTLGKDRYTQEDVRQAARAFTGYTVDNQGTVTFRPELHDPGEKVILGNRGNFGPLDMADVVLDHHPDGAVAARYIAARLATSLYRPDPEPEVVAAMADVFAGSGFEIKPMVRALLLRPEFSDGPGVTIKAPAEFVAGAMRALGLVATPMTQGRFRELDTLAAFCAYMGQELYNPPNVAGWKGGATWANTATTLSRYNFSARIAKVVTDDVVGAVLALAGGEPRETTAPWMARLGLLDLMPATQAALGRYLDESAAAGADPPTRARGVLTLLLASPDYNLR
jgi:uncharacterized protein (DUF1800 family)